MSMIEGRRQKPHFFSLWHFEYPFGLALRTQAVDDDLDEEHFASMDYERV